MKSGGSIVMSHHHIMYPSHTRLLHTQYFHLDNKRVGFSRFGSGFKRINSFTGSRSYYSEQLGVNPNEKGKKTAGIDQDELVDPSVLADPDSLFYEFNGVKVHYKIFEADSPIENVAFDQGSSPISTSNFPMILLHGFGASLFSWHRVIKQLAQISGSKTLAFDRPAFGLTSRVNLQEHFGNNRKDVKPLNPYSMIFSVLATLNFIDFLSAEKAVLIGHSAGSLVVVNAYFEAPERVAALILVAPAIIAPLINRRKAKKEKSGADTENEEVISKMAVDNNPFIEIYNILSKFLKHIVQAIVNLVTWSRNMINSLYKKALSTLLRSALAVFLVRLLINTFGITAVKNAWYDQNQATQHILDGYTKPLKVKGWDKALAEFVAAMLADSSSESKPSNTNRLDEISCPVLIITGDSDRIVPSWNAVRLAKAIPGSSLEIIKNCGHLPHEEKSEEFVLIIAKFLRSVLSGSHEQLIQAAK